LKAAGYSLWLSRLINTHNFGVPQKRVRYILVASRRGNQEAFNYALKNEMRKGPSCLDAIGDLPEQCGPNSDYIGPPSNDYQKWARHSCTRLSFHLAPKHRPKTLEKIKKIPQGKSLRSLERAPLFSYKYYRLKADEPAKTIVYPMGSVIIHPIYNRVISVREAARLQALPDSLVFTGGLMENYYQVADATPVLLAKALAKALLMGLGDA
ncbi:DNA cytosine methyltransferase, partial [archaeon]|nr:DNA cytosine methyltransferase [archaeon]